MENLQSERNNISMKIAYWIVFVALLFNSLYAETGSSLRSNFNQLFIVWMFFGISFSICYNSSASHGKKVKNLLIITLALGFLSYGGYSMYDSGSGSSYHEQASGSAISVMVKVLIGGYLGIALSRYLEEKAKKRLD
jgi:cytochrome b